MLTISFIVPEFKIDYNLCNLEVSKNLIKEVDDALICELNHNNTDLDLEKLEFIYEGAEDDNLSSKK